MQQSQAPQDEDASTRYHLAEADELALLAVQAGGNGGRDAHAVFDRFRAIVSHAAMLLMHHTSIVLQWQAFSNAASCSCRAHSPLAEAPTAPARP